MPITTRLDAIAGAITEASCVLNSNCELYIAITSVLSGSYTRLKTRYVQSLQPKLWIQPCGDAGCNLLYSAAPADWALMTWFLKPFG